MKQMKWVFLLSLFLAACATVGESTPQTFNERMAAGIATVASVRTTAAALLKQGRITVDDAQNVQAQCDNIRTGLDVARKIHTQDPNAGNAKLTAAVTALTALQTYLQTRNAR